MRNQRNNPDNGAGLASDILEYLRQMTGGRPLANTAELGQVSGTAPQTIRRNHSERGEFLGLRPIKIGNRLFWPLTDIARVLSGYSGEQNRVRYTKVDRSEVLPEQVVSGGNHG